MIMGASWSQQPEELKSKHGIDLSLCREVRTLLESKVLSDIPGIDRQNLIIFDSKSTLRECFVQLIEHNIHSAPVFDSKKGQFIGLLDFKDFAKYVVDLISADISSDEAGRRLSFPLDDSAGSLVDYSTQNPYYPIFSNSSMFAVLSGFGHHGVHRRPVLDPDDPTKVIAMISQLTIIKWLHSQKEHLKALDQKPIMSVIEEAEEDKNINKFDFVLTVTPRASMFSVMKLLTGRGGISGVAVIDPTNNGRLIGNISVSDLRYLTDNKFDNINLSVGEFISSEPRKPLIAVPEKASLGDVIAKIAQHNVYRCYVLDSKGKPLAVVTPTDIITAVLLIANTEEED